MRGATGPLLRSAALAAAANIVSLAFAAWVFEKFTIKLGWFVLAVVLFTVLTVVLRGVVLNMVSRFTRAYTIVGGLALTYVALLITDRATPDGGFSIEGWPTWLGVTLIVWAAGIAYGEVDHHAPPEVPPVER
jgi:hypothetical protein